MTNKPITYLSRNLGPDAGSNDALIGVRVVPAGRDGDKVLCKTLNYGEPDSGDGITLCPGEKLLFPAGNVKITIQDIDRENKPGTLGYAAVANTVWTWMQFGAPPNPDLFRFLFAAARRLDVAYIHCVNVLRGLGGSSDEPYIKTRARLFKALGYAESMCVALNRSTNMIQAMPAKFSVTTAVPNTIGTILPALKEIRNAFEHIDERAFGNVHNKQHPDALSIFDQKDFASSGVLSYASYSLDLKKDVVPALISSRQFIFDVAVEKAGSAKTLNAPIEFF